MRSLRQINKINRNFFYINFIKPFNNQTNKQMKRVLVIMSINPDFIQFAVPELKSVLSQLPIPFETLFKEELTIQPNHSYEITHQTLKNFPYVTLNVPDFEKYQSFFQKACKQSVMLHKLVLLISEGQSYAQLVANRDEQILKQRCRNWQDTVVCDFISRNRVLGRTYQLQKITKLLGDMDIRGKIDISKASKRFQLIEDHVWYQEHHESPVDSTLKKVYFGLELCNNKVGTAKFNSVYELSKRIYLGPTSADNDLAFMMCNQAKIGEGSFIIDPFVGTGGLIIPPASKGAYVFGCDLDMRVLNGYSVGRVNKRSPYYSEDKKFEIYTPKILLNFEQYGFNYPNICRMDSTNLAFKKEEIFDAIITDPPYGLRAMSRSVTTSKKEPQATEKVEQQKISPIPEKQNQAEVQVEVEQQPQKVQVNNEALVKDSSEKTEKTQQETQIEMKQMQQKLKKAEKRRVKKQTRLQKKSQMTEEQKDFKKSITQKLNRQRIDQWDKFDKGKVECTEREKIFERLINFAKTNLKQGGRLVFLYPIYEEEQYKKILSLPKHKGFKVVDMSENKLSKNNSRILVTLEKEFVNSSK